MSSTAPTAAARAARERFHLYVLELPDGAKVHCEGGCGTKEVLYVGSTGKTVAERFAEHRAGGASHITTRFPPVRLREDLSRGKHAHSREKIEELEVKLARSLRAKGYSVCQG